MQFASFYATICVISSHKTRLITRPFASIHFAFYYQQCCHLKLTFQRPPQFQRLITPPPLRGGAGGEAERGWGEALKQKLYFRFKMRCAQSDSTTNAPARIAVSLITSLPAPESNGNPCSPLPKSGTQHSGVVTRNDSVPNVIRMTRPDPTKPILGNQMPKSVNTPNDMMSNPKPCEKP